MEAIFADVYPILPSGKVYHEYLKDSKHFNADRQEFYDLVEMQILRKNKFKYAEILSNHDIHNIMKMIDIHIDLICNVIYTISFFSLFS